jgi:hypothetical protein
MSNKEYNRGYQSGYFAGLEQARRDAAGAQADLANFALSELAARLMEHTGYIRIGHSASSGFWARYKWSAGTHAGFYTFGGNPALPDALGEVCSRILAVEAGKLKATPDRPAWKK